MQKPDLKVVPFSPRPPSEDEEAAKRDALEALDEMRAKIESDEMSDIMMVSRHQGGGVMTVISSGMWDNPIQAVAAASLLQSRVVETVRDYSEE